MNAYEPTIKQISADEMVAALKRQAGEIGSVGEIDLFGETRTVSDVARAISELSRVADLYATELANR